MIIRLRSTITVLMRENAKDNAVMRSARVSPNQGQTVGSTNGIKSVGTPVTVHKIAVLPDNDVDHKDFTNNDENKNGIAKGPKSILRKETRYPSPEPTTGLVDFFQRVFSPEFDSPALERVYRRYFSNQKRPSLLYLLCMVVVINVSLIILYSINFSNNKPIQLNRIIISSIGLVASLLVLSVFVCGDNKRDRSVVLCRILWLLMFLQLLLDLALDYSPLAPPDSIGMFIFFIYITYNVFPLRLYSCVVICLIATICHTGFVGVLAKANKKYVGKQVSYIPSVDVNCTLRKAFSLHIP